MGMIGSDESMSHDSFEERSTHSTHSRHKPSQGMTRAYIVQDAVGGHDGYGTRVGGGMRVSKSMKVIANKRGGRKLLPKEMEPFLSTQVSFYH